VDHFRRLFARKYHKSDFALPAGLIEEMRLYPWPGNVRELRNVLEKLVLLGDAALPQLPWRCLRPLAPAAAPAAPAAGEPPPVPGTTPGADEIDRLAAAVMKQQGDCSLSDVVKAVERAVIVRTLNLSGGNRRVAAQRLGVSYKTLFNKLSEHGIQVKAKAD
jgi:DNA-binding NtrC family response regulator